MKLVPIAVSKNLGRVILHTKKSSPTLLFGVGIIGVVATTVLASKATLQVEEVLDNAQKKLTMIDEVVSDKKYNEKYSVEDAKMDKVKVYTRTTVELGKLYGPAIVVGIVSIACLTGSHVVLTRRNVALTAAYATLEKGFAEYRQRVVDEVGEDKEREIRYNAQESAKKNEKGKEGKTVKKIGPDSASIYARFFDSTNPNWSPDPERNIMFLRAQQNYANDLLRSRGHVFLNDIYDNLCLERSSPGAVVGWVWQGDKDNYVDFGVFDKEMNPRLYDFFTGQEDAVLLDFNVDGVVYDKI